MEILLALVAGLITAFIFTFIKLPISALRMWSGSAG